MLRVRSIRRPISSRSLFFAAALAFCFTPARAAAQSQDVAEAARQEKARKAEGEKAQKEKKDSHVYTNEDLKRAQILTPEARAQLEARKKNQTVPPDAQPADALDAAAPKAPESLGEVARHYRREKAAREAAQALKSPQRLPLPTELSQPALASPRPLRVEPLRPVAPATHPAKPSRSALAHPSGRRDPFSRPTFSRLPALPSPPPRTSPTAPRIVGQPFVPAPSGVIVPRATTPSAPLAIESPKSTPSAPGPLLVRPQPLPVAPAVGTSRIIVQPGDSLWKLARLHLGKGSRWRDFLAVNPALPPPDRILAGSSLIVPERTSAPSAGAMQSAHAAPVLVRRGDSLWKIAAKQFGSGMAWSCLAQANPQLLDADHIYPGDLLSIPQSCRAGAAVVGSTF